MKQFGWQNILNIAGGKFTGSILYALLILFMLILYAQKIPQLENLNYSLEDKIRIAGRAELRSDNIVIVGIDSRSISRIGQWPWNQGVISDLLITICDDQPRGVLLDFPLEENVTEYLSGNSESLAESMRECGNVIIPFDIVVSQHGKLSQPVPTYFRSLAITPVEDSPALKLPRAAAAFISPEIFATNAKAVGFNYYEDDPDGKVRTANLITNYKGFVYPSAPLQLANLFLGGDPSSISLNNNNELLIAGKKIKIDNQGRVLLNLPDEPVPYPIYSAIDILTGKSQRGCLTGKAVIVAATDYGLSEEVVTNIDNAMPRYNFNASVVQNIISSKFARRPGLPIPVDLLAILVIGIFGAAFLPKATLFYRLVVLFVVGFILVNLSFVLSSSFNLVMSVLYPVLTIILFLIASPVVKHIEKKNLGLTLAAGIDLRKILGDEPVAVAREGDKEVSLDEIPTRFLANDKPSPDAFQETIRLDFEAIKKYNLKPPDKQPEYEDDTSQAEKEQVEIKVDMKPPVDPESQTKAFIPDLLDVDMSNIRQPDTQLSIDPESSTSPPTELKTPAPQPDELAKKKKLYGVKFSSEGQPVSFGRYEVIEPLGMGAMGTVYKGKDPAIDRLVALKTIRLDTIADQSEIGELKERLTREAIAAGNLSHPNIVTIYDVGTQGNLQYIAMEYLDGYTLESVLNRNLQLNFRIVASIIIQVCSALEYAHSMGIVHRDIKPANIMVMENFKLKVMDFGIAYFQSSTMTQTGVAMGTPNYISPEQLQGKEVTPSSDIFSLGVVLYELLTHKKPFTADNISSLVYQIVNEDPAPLTSSDPNIPALFNVVTQKALAKDPTDRYISVKKFAEALEDFTVTLGKKPSVV